MFKLTAQELELLKSVPVTPRSVKATIAGSITRVLLSGAVPEISLYEKEADTAHPSSLCKLLNHLGVKTSTGKAYQNVQCNGMIRKNIDTPPTEEDYKNFRAAVAKKLASAPAAVPVTA
jgi:hypothetical protein